MQLSLSHADAIHSTDNLLTAHYEDKHHTHTHKPRTTQLSLSLADTNSRHTARLAPDSEIQARARAHTHTHSYNPSTNTRPYPSPPQGAEDPATAHRRLGRPIIRVPIRVIGTYPSNFHGGSEPAYDTASGSVSDPVSETVPSQHPSQHPSHYQVSKSLPGRGLGGVRAR